jgi:hypothetical protein
MGEAAATSRTNAGSKARKNPLDRLRGKKKPATLTVIVGLDDDTADDLAYVKRQLANAMDLEEGQEPDTDEITRLTTELEKIQSKYDKSTVPLKFTSPGRKKVRELEDEHPPTEEQIAEWRIAQGEPDPDDPTKIIPSTSVPGYNPETYPSALIALCLGVGIEDLEEVTEDWNDTEWMQLWVAAQVVTQKSQVNWGKD